MSALYRISADGWIATEGVGDPEGEADGDRFWVWSDGAVVRLNFEEWDGQADAELPGLLRAFPELGGLPIDRCSPWDPDADMLEEVASDLPGPMRTRDVEVWYHGTTADRLERMVEEGMRGDLPFEERVWRNADVPHGVVYLTSRRSIAAEYAEHAARGGRDPVVVEIDASELIEDLFEVDRDFPLLAASRSATHVSLRDLGDADASLTLTHRVGYAGPIPATALSAVHDRDGRRELHADPVGRPTPSP